MLAYDEPDVDIFNGISVRVESVTILFICIALRPPEVMLRYCNSVSPPYLLDLISSLTILCTIFLPFSARIFSCSGLNFLGLGGVLLVTLVLAAFATPGFLAPIKFSAPLKPRQKKKKKCPVGSCLIIGSLSQYAYALIPPSPNGLQLSGLLKRINTGLNAR